MKIRINDFRVMDGICWVLYIVLNGGPYVMFFRGGLMSSSGSYNSPCAACKFLRRKCMPGCIFAPYFPPEEPQKFANVHKIFGASNVTKLLNELPPHQREDAVNSLAYEAEARVRDPVYGCVGAISYLQRQVHRLQKELDAANADLIRHGYGAYNNNNISGEGIVDPMNTMQVPTHPSTTLRQRPGTSGDGQGGGGFYQSFDIPYPLPWSTSDHHENGPEGGGGGGGNM